MDCKTLQDDMVVIVIVAAESDSDCEFDNAWDCNGDDDCACDCELIEPPNATQA